MSCIDPKKYTEFEDVVMSYLTEKEGISKEKAELVAYQQWKQTIAEHSSITEMKMFKQLATSAGSIDVTFNGGRVKQKYKLLNVGYIDGKYIVSVQNPRTKTISTYTFKEGITKSLPNEIEKKDGTIGERRMNIDAIAGIYGSSDDTNVNKALYDRVELDLLNDLDNSVVMLDKLKSIDGSDLSDTHYSRLKKVLGMFVGSHKKFIPAMNVYLNEQASKVGGVLRVDDGIYFGVSDIGKYAKTDISNSEMYVEELIHAATVFGLKIGGPEAQSAKRRIQQLREQVRREFYKQYGIDGWKALLPEVSIDKKYEEERAKKDYDYIFNNEATGIEEFIAKGLTNEKLISLLDNMEVNAPKEFEGKTIFERLTHWVGKIFDIVRMKYDKENFTSTATDVLVRMSAQLAEANNKAIKSRDDVAFVAEVMDNIENLDRKMGDWIQKFIAKRKDIDKLPKPPASGSNGFQYALYFGRLLPFLIGNTTGQVALKEFLKILGMKYGGDIQTLLAQAMEPDTFERAVEKLGRLNENIDRIRESLAADTAISVKNAFKKINKVEREAITIAGLDVDIQSIVGTYDVVSMLENEAELKATIVKLRKELRSKADTKETGNYYVAQATGLGYYLATHQPKSLAQLLNASLIAKGHNRNTNDKTPDVEQETIDMIDRLATLEGLLCTDEGAKNVLAELIKREPKGFAYVVGLTKGIIADSKTRVFGSNELGMLKGYTKEIFDEDVTVLTRPTADAAKLKREGFKKVFDLEKAEGDLTSVPTSMYVNKWHSQQNLKKGALRYTDLRTRGTTMYDVHKVEDELEASKRSKINVIKLEIRSIKDLKEMEAGKFDFTKKEGKSLVPVYGKEGNVVTYRYMMSKWGKRTYLNQDVNAAAVLGRTLASTQDKVTTAEHNKEVFDALVVDSNNYNERTGKAKDLSAHHRYFRLEPNSADPEVREAWSILPDTFKQMMRDHRLGYLPVRADVFKAVFGMREASILDLLGKIPVLGEIGGAITPKEVKYAIKVAEYIWTQIVNLAKVNIVIKIPEVLIRNIISNLMIAPLKGHFNLLKTAKLQLEGAKALMDYLHKTHELNELENAKLAGNPNQLDIGKIVSLREDLKKHQVAHMVDAGMFQAIIEDMGRDEFRSSNKIVRSLGNYMESAPGFIKDGTNLLFLTEKTRFFKFMTAGTQFSDFASKYALMELDKEKYIGKLHTKMGTDRRIQIKDIPLLSQESNKEKYASKQEATQLLITHIENSSSDLHINYGKFDGQILDWINRVMLAMFTKYTFRITRPAIKTAIEHPLTFLGTIGAQFVTGDIDDISDSMGNHLAKFGNFSPLSGLIDDIPAYQAVTNIVSLTY